MDEQGRFLGLGSKPAGGLSGRRTPVGNGRLAGRLHTGARNAVSRRIRHARELEKSERKVNRAAEATGATPGLQGSGQPVAATPRPRLHLPFRKADIPSKPELFGQIERFDLARARAPKIPPAKKDQNLP